MAMEKEEEKIYNPLSHRHNNISYQYRHSCEGHEAILDSITFTSHYSFISSNSSTSWDSLSSGMTPPTCSSPTLLYIQVLFNWTSPLCPPLPWSLRTIVLIKPPDN